MANLKLSLMILDQVLGLPAGSVSAIQMDSSLRYVDVTVSSMEFAEDAEVTALQASHDCGGTCWYRTELTVPEPVARKVKIPSQ